jgi:hypothetical protein
MSAELRKQQEWRYQKGLIDAYTKPQLCHHQNRE